MTQIRGYAANPVIGVAGSGRITNSEIGFYDTTPIIQQTNPVMGAVDPAGWIMEAEEIFDSMGLMLKTIP